jgi:hypothetical protein
MGGGGEEEGVSTNTTVMEDLPLSSPLF